MTVEQESTLQPAAARGGRRVLGNILRGLSLTWAASPRGFVLIAASQAAGYR